MNCPRCGHGISEGTRFCPGCEAAILAAPEQAARIEVTQEVGTVEAGRIVGVDLGEVLGDVNIGSYTLRIGTLNGGVVNVAAPRQHIPPRLRPIPVLLLPRPFPGFLGRRQEVSAASTAFGSALPLEFHGRAGIGKTKLLNHLAHHRFSSSFPDGVVCLPETRHKPVEDLLLELFDAFYEREPEYLPTPVQVRHALRGKLALFVLDDVAPDRDGITTLMDAAPDSTFLLASTGRCLWGDGLAIALRGLPPDEAFTLLERELGRPFVGEERSIAQELCNALEGHPLSILQLAALVREDNRSLADLAGRLHDGAPIPALTEQALAACPEDERTTLAALAVPMGESVGVQHLNALTGLADTAPVLDSLERRGLVQSHSPRYSLTGSLDETLRDTWDLASSSERALGHFAAWAEQHQQVPERVVEEAGAIMGVLQRAVQEGRSEEALRLGRAVESSLALSGRWGVWARVLGWELRAARALEDRAAEAWSLHQSGTRALCLEDNSVARADLSGALRLRESLGDEEGAAVTRHNLNLLGGPGGDNGPEGNGAGGGGWSFWPWLGVSVIVAFLLLLALGGVQLAGDGREPTPGSGIPTNTEQSVNGTGSGGASSDTSGTGGAGLENEGNSRQPTEPARPIYGTDDDADDNGSGQVDGAGNRKLIDDNDVPTIIIRTPANGAVFRAVGEPVVADFECRDEPGGSGLALCRGDVPDGAPLGASSVNPRSFTVIATDNAGNSNQATNRYSYFAEGCPEGQVQDPDVGCVDYCPEGDLSGNATDGTCGTEDLPPEITITSPAEGTTYVLGESVYAAYSCTDEVGGSGVKSCSGTVPNGALLDTDSPGAKSFTVIAEDNAGNLFLPVTHNYTVVCPGGQAPDPDTGDCASETTITRR